MESTQEIEKIYRELIRQSGDTYLNLREKDALWVEAKIIYDKKSQ